MTNNLISTGKLINEYLESNKHTASELAEKSGVSLNDVLLILSDKKKVSEEIADGLHKLIEEISPDFLMKYDSKYQEQAKNI